MNKTYNAKAALTAATIFFGGCAAEQIVYSTANPNWKMEVPEGTHFSYVSGNTRISKQGEVITYVVKQANKDIKVTVGPHGLIPEGCTYEQIFDAENKTFEPLRRVIKAKGDIGVLVEKASKNTGLNLDN